MSDLPDYIDLVPRAAVCRRNANSFDAEIAFERNEHRVIASGLPDRGTAKIIADEKANELIHQIRRVVNDALLKYPKAKP